MANNVNILIILFIKWSDPFACAALETQIVYFNQYNNSIKEAINMRKYSYHITYNNYLHSVYEQLQIQSSYTIIKATSDE